MTGVLPPVEGAQGDVLQVADRSQVAHAAGEKLSLTRLRQIQVEAACTKFNVDLKVLRETHVRNQEQRQELLIKEQNRALKREAKQERIRMKHANATKIQALIRSFLIRRQVLPTVLEAKRKEELQKSRVALEDTMLGLHQNIHDLAFLHEDRNNAAMRLQKWWRGVLAKRVVAIISLRHHLLQVATRMAKAATRISVIARGRQARMGCFRLRLEKEHRVQQAKKRQHDHMIRSVIKLQSHIRRRRAMKNIQERRAANALECEGSNDNRDRVVSPKSPKSPEHRDRRRRPRNAESSPMRGGSGRPKHRGAVIGPAAPQGIMDLEAGGMLVAEPDISARHQRKAGHVQKLRRAASGRRAQKFDSHSSNVSDAKPDSSNPVFAKLPRCF